ncbi:carbohydrate sulfotransferase 11-like [Saccostrea cucullata]|uniref:carbohydrate sulfotransferase 11-like n=1 Tax=Saccostrea cuccullata TaxID=36930 RepID=UPI002ED6573E
MSDFFIEEIPNMQNSHRNISYKILTPPRKINELYLIKRLQKYRESCKGREFNFGNEPLYTMKSHFKMSTSHHILYCSVEKAGSTFWKRVLQMLDSTNIDSPFQILPLHVNDRGQSFYEHRVYNVLAALRTNFVFMFARNPFNRLLSGYLDKVYTANPFYWNLFGEQIRHHKRNSMSCHSNITFQEIVEYVIKAEGKFIKKRDPHFMAMFDKCKPCQIPYDFIGKMETFESDVQFLMKTWNISKFRGIAMKQNVVDDIFLDVATSLEDRRQLILKCISLHEAYRRSWKHMQIKGLISDKQTYPFNEIESANITPIRLIKVMKLAHLNSDPKELMRQKAKYFNNIYRTVPQKTLRMLTEALRPDFHIFDYNPFPKAIFNERKRQLNHSDIFNF